MPQLILDLPQGVLDALAAIATEAKDPRFANAKGMLELRAKLEAKERYVRLEIAARKAQAETEPLP